MKPKGKIDFYELSFDKILSVLEVEDKTELVKEIIIDYPNKRMVIQVSKGLSPDDLNKKNKAGYNV